MLIAILVLQILTFVFGALPIAATFVYGVYDEYKKIKEKRAQEAFEKKEK